MDKTKIYALSVLTYLLGCCIPTLAQQGEIEFGGLFIGNPNEYWSPNPKTDPTIKVENMPTIDFRDYIFFKENKDKNIFDNIFCKAVANYEHLSYTISGSSLRIYLYDETKSDGLGALIYAANVNGSTDGRLIFSEVSPDPDYTYLRASMLNTKINSLNFFISESALHFYDIDNNIYPNSSIYGKNSMTNDIENRVKNNDIANKSTDIPSTINRDDITYTENLSPILPVVVRLEGHSCKIKKLYIPFLTPYNRRNEGFSQKELEVLFPELNAANSIINYTIKVNDGNAYSEPPFLNGLKLGDKITITVTTKRTTKKPVIEGLSGTWIAKSGGDALYYTTPSIIPGGLKPFLGFDNAVHGTIVRKYPQKTNGTDDKYYPDWEAFNSPYYYQTTWTLEYTVSREMDPYATNNPVFDWTSLKTRGGLGKSLPEQRNSQREGYNMHLLSHYPDLNFVYKNFSNVLEISTSKSKYVTQFDPDEILYVNRKEPSTILPPLTANQKLFVTDSENEPWKIVWENDDLNPIRLMIDAYYHSNVKGLTDPSLIKYYTKGYDGYEIQNVGTNSTNVFGTSTSRTQPAKGVIKITVGSDTKTIQMFTTNRFYCNDDGIGSFTYCGENNNYRNFYANLTGTLNPSNGQLNVPYSLVGLKDQPDETIKKYYLEYEYEDHIGNIQKQVATIKDLNTTDFNLVKTTGTFKAHFDIKGWGYHTVTAYYKHADDSEPVMVAGKQLLPTSVRFVSLDKVIKDANNKYVDEYKTTKDGAYIYMEEYFDNPQIASEESFGKQRNRYNKEYTFKQGDMIHFKIFDADPNIFKIKEEEWYLSARTRQLRVPNDSLSVNNNGKGYLKTYYYKLNSSNVAPIFDPNNPNWVEISQFAMQINPNEYGSGFSQDGGGYDFVWEVPNNFVSGTYDLAVVYRGKSSVHNLLHIENYDTDGNIAKLGTMEKSTGLSADINSSTGPLGLDVKHDIKNIKDIVFNDATIPNSHFTTCQKYIVAQTRYIYNDFKYKKGPRNYDDPWYNPTNNDNNKDNHNNRFGLYNDFDTYTIWTLTPLDNPNSNTIISPLLNQTTEPDGNHSNISNPNSPIIPSEVDIFLSDYSNADWYPDVWLRHFSDKGKDNQGKTTYLPPMDMRIDDPRYDNFDMNYLHNGTKDIMDSNIASKLDGIFNAGVNVESWQYRVPWISWTNSNGPRVRTNVKPIYNMETFYDSNSGVFSGSRVLKSGISSDEDYEQAVFNFLMTDEQKLKEQLYYKLRNGQLLIFNPNSFKHQTDYKSFILKAYSVPVYNQKLTDKSTWVLIDSKPLTINPLNYNCPSQHQRMVTSTTNDTEIIILEEQTEGMLLSPNPTNGKQCSVSFDKAVSNVELQLIDMTGSIKGYWNLGNQTHFVIPTNGISEGIYLVRATTDQGIFVKKLVITN